MHQVKVCVSMRLYLFIITWADRAPPNFCHFNAVIFNVVVVVDRFYIALSSALEQTHCARM